MRNCISLGTEVKLKQNSRHRQSFVLQGFCFKSHLIIFLRPWRKINPWSMNCRLSLWSTWDHILLEMPRVGLSTKNTKDNVRTERLLASGKKNKKNKKRTDGRWVKTQKKSKALTSLTVSSDQAEPTSLKKKRKNEHNYFSFLGDTISEFFGCILSGTLRFPSLRTHV